MCVNQVKRSVTLVAMSSVQPTWLTSFVVTLLDSYSRLRCRRPCCTERLLLSELVFPHEAKLSAEHVHVFILPPRRLCFHFVCLFVSRITQYCTTDFHKTRWKGDRWAKEETIRFTFRLLNWLMIHQVFFTGAVCALDSPERSLVIQLR